MREAFIRDTTTLLRLDKLSLRNFRCFKKCSIELHPKLTVFVAENAQGKTAILDAIGIALDVFVSSISSRGKAHGFERDSIHLIQSDDNKMMPSLPTEFHAEGYVDSELVKWSRSLAKYDPHSRTSTKDTKALCLAAEHLRSRSDSFIPNGADLPQVLPVVVFYGTGRLWSEHRLTDAKKGTASSEQGRYLAYRDCLSSSSSFKSFVDWYESAFSDLRRSTSKVRQTEERLDKQIVAVEEAVRMALEPTGWTSINWEFPPEDADGRQRGAGFIVVKHPTHGRFPLSLLSDGVKNMVALVADLAYRCIRLNPHLGESAARQTPGVVLIDEVDMHLHPRWQQLVVELLQKAFPAMQIILSTHSPQVLSTVNAESIRLIHLDNGQGTITEPKFQTRGVESTDVLATIMGVDPVPQVEESKWLNDYRALIETGKDTSSEGLELKSKLRSHFSDDHPLLLDCERLIRFQNFKRRKIQEGQ